MKVVVGADDSSETLGAVIDSLIRRGHEVHVLDEAPWPMVAADVAKQVAEGKSEMGVLMCWTGTGTSMMANRSIGVRAALCWEPWIADGARRWNDANVLVMSLKRTAPDEAERILDAWFAVQEPDASEAENISRLDGPPR